MSTRTTSVLIAFALTTLMVLSSDHPRASSSTDGGFSHAKSQLGPEGPALLARAQSPRRNSSPREIASGSEDSYQASREIVLNIRPCRGTADLVVFHWPFRRTLVGSVKCPNGEVGIVQVEQL